MWFPFHWLKYTTPDKVSNFFNKVFKRICKTYSGCGRNNNCNQRECRYLWGKPKSAHANVYLIPAFPYHIRIHFSVNLPLCCIHRRYAQNGFTDQKFDMVFIYIKKGYLYSALVPWECMYIVVPIIILKHMPFSFSMVWGNLPPWTREVNHFLCLPMP